MEQKDELQLSKEVTRRNFLIRKFFTDHGIDITLMGDVHNPLIVMDDNIVLSCYAHNFDLIFKDDTHEGNEVFRVKLRFHTQEVKFKLAKWIAQAKHRKVYLFKAKGYYFSKYVKVLNNQSPLFSPKKTFAYYVFSRQKAIKVKDELKKVEPAIEIVY